MKKSKQLQFFSKSSLEHGGKLIQHKRKSLRPLTTKHPIHVVLRSDRARGPLSLLNHQNKIDKILTKWAHKFHISIYEKAIVTNHIHLLIRGKKRIQIQNFFRTIAALIARQVTGSKKAKAFGRFWSYLIYSRCLSSWKREFQIVKNYIVQNTLETMGLASYKPRKSKKYALF